VKRILVVAAVFVIAVLGFARPAGAHPLGNFSVNQLAALDLRADRIDVAATVDLAELPTVQEKEALQGDGGAALCAEFARDFAVTVDGTRLAWTVGAPELAFLPGAAGLQTSRISCALTSAVELSTDSAVVHNGFRADRVGWRELTATAGGVHLVDSPLPAQSVSGGLTAYPEDLLSSPLNVRDATLAVAPGDGPASTATSALPGGSRFFGSAWLAGAERTLRGWVADPHLGPVVGVLAVLLALTLGAAHAALPGHGKTVMAAYLAGRHGRPRDALAVGATVTATHTGGVLVLGLLLTSVAGLAGERILGWLGVASGALVAVLGVTMLVRLLRGRSTGHHHHHESHDHDHSHSHSHSQSEAGHTHDHDRSPGRLALISMGIAGGLVPSPSALVILLGAIGLGRTGFGVLLVLGYGLGMAGTLTAAGLLLIKVKDRWAGRLPRFATRITLLLPTGTAALVLLVGLGLAGRAFATL
jgi:nickel/cobalt exporter